MDSWIFIVAAGSGYLAQFWQNSRNPKEASGDITRDDDDHSGSPSPTFVTKKCHYVPSSKRRSPKRRFHQKWHGSKLNEGGSTILGGCLTTNFLNPLVDASESLGVLALHNGVGEDACSCPSPPTQFERCHDPAPCYSTNGSNNPSRCPECNSFSDLWPQKCCDFIPDGNKTSFNSIAAFPDDCGFYISNLYSKACLDHPCRISEVHGCCSIRRIKDRKESTMENEVQALSSYRTCVTGCHHQYEDFCTVNLGDSHSLPNCEVASSIKVRSLHENERGGSCFAKRRQSLAHCRPITCPSSYISDQLGNDCRQEMKSGYKHNSLAQATPLCEQVEQSGISNLNALSSHQLVGDEISDFTSSRNTSSKVLDNINLPNLAGKQKEGTSLKSGLPLYCNKGSMEARGDGLCGDGFWLKGNHLAKMLLFNFGVGVGMMFAVMSSKKFSQQIIWQLEDVMSTLKSVEEEIQAIRKSRLGLHNNGDVRENILPEQSPSPLQNVCGLVEQVRVSLVKNTGSAFKTDCDCSLERAGIEAELEAELERMELDLNLTDTEFHGQHSCADEDGLEIGNISEGELSTRHIRGENDAHSTSADANIFSHESIHYRNCAVSPVELAKRLYEVLETRQEEKIIELEAEIKRLDNGLQAKEHQYQAWKQSVRHLLQETACINLPSCRKDVYAESENTSVKDLSFSTSIENLFAAGLKGPVPSFPNNEDIPFNPVDTALSMYPSISQVRMCSDGEACEVWFHPLNNTCRDSPRRLHNGRLKDADKTRDLRSPMAMVEPEVMDVSYGSVTSTCTSKDAVVEILSSAPCLITSLGIAQEPLGMNQYFKSDVGAKTSNKQEFFSLEWNRNRMPYPDTVCRSEDNFAQDVMFIHDSCGNCGKILEWSSSDDSCNSSDLDDEQLGQKLIERVVQKGRKGVLMVEAAKLIMATADLDNTSLHIETPSG